MAEVYECYLKGRFHFNKWTVETVKKGIEYFQQALQLDPDYAPAYAGIADCYNSLQFLGSAVGGSWAESVEGGDPRGGARSEFGGGACGARLR